MLKESSVRISTFALCTLATLAVRPVNAGDVADRVVAAGLAEYRRPVPAVLQLRYFGGLLRWPIPSLSLDSADVLSTRAGRAFLTLDRYLGRPVLERGLDAAAAQPRPLPLDDFFAIVDGAVGEDLDWFWRIAFDPRENIDYAVGAVVNATASDCDGAPCVHVSVTVARHGAPFTGTSNAPTGPYESGRAVHVATTFANGTRVVDHWDGRAKTKTFVYAAPAPAVRVEVDPDHVMVLDARRTNNSWTAFPRGSMAARRWAARWAVWLQNLLLTSGFLV